jgi:hypothetical protein
VDNSDLVGCRHTEDLPASVAVAANVLQRNKTRKQQERKQLVEDLGLTPKTQHSRLEGVPTYQLPKLANPYPPPERDIYETEEIATIWRNHRAGKKHPDRRSKRSGHWMELEKLDEKKLALIVGVEESVIIRDADSDEIVAVVLRRFSRNGEILEWINGIVDENVGLRRGIRVCQLARPVSQH